MQIDRWHVRTEPEEESPYQERSTGMMHFPIWIDEPVLEQNSSLLYRDTDAMELCEPHEPQPGERMDTGAQRGSQRRHHVPNPATPVPPRASANPSGVVKIRPRYHRSYTEPQEDDVTRVPTMPPPTMWQYESPGYKAESSLSSLSLVVSDDSLPAARPPSIDELDTLPPDKGRKRQDVTHTPAIEDLPAHDYYGLQLPSMDISRLTTRPPAATPQHAKMQSLRDEYYIAPPDVDDVIEADTVLSTAVSPGLSLSPVSDDDDLASVRRRGKRQQYEPSFALHPLDRVRWWLLYPGRLEMLLWIVGTSLLVAIICVLVFVTTISLGIVSVGHPATTHPDSTATILCTNVQGDNTSCDVSSASSPVGLKIILLNTTAPLTSTPLQLRGQGFSVHGRVTCTYDNNQPCHPDALQADGHGEFTVVLALTSSLRPGYHRLVIYDESRKQSVSLTILFTADTASS